MAIDALVKPFLLLPLFQGLKPLQLTEIVRRADRIIYRPGDIIIEEDQPGEAAIIIISGEAVRVSSETSGDAAQPIMEGSMIGELAMLVETIHSATIVARGTVKALRLSRTEMHEAMADDPALADHLTQKITSRLHRLAQELRSVDQALADIAGFDPLGQIPTSQVASAPAYTAAPLH
ncbi:MAG: cyclic nucleotide-binding domain-containing protein [Hyphomicrobium sp.]